MAQRQAAQTGLRSPLRNGRGRPAQQAAPADQRAPQGGGDRTDQQQPLLQQHQQTEQGAAQRAHHIGQSLPVKMPQRQIIPPRRQASQRTQHRPRTQRRDHQRQRPPRRQHGTGQTDCDQRHRHRRHQRAAQVVQHLPAVDGRHMETAPAQQHRPQLPVAARPAVYP